MFNENEIIKQIISIKNPQKETFTNGKLDLMSFLPLESHIVELSIQYDDKYVPITTWNNCITFNIGDQQGVKVNYITKELNLKDIDITTFELTTQFSSLIDCTIVCGCK